MLRKSLRQSWRLLVHASSSVWIRSIPCLNVTQQEHRVTESDLEAASMTIQQRPLGSRVASFMLGLRRPVEKFKTFGMIIQIGSRSLSESCLAHDGNTGGSLNRKPATHQPAVKGSFAHTAKACSVQGDNTVSAISQVPRCMIRCLKRPWGCITSYEWV
jgi:hypothetical protein